MLLRSSSTPILGSLLSSSASSSSHHFHESPNHQHPLEKASSSPFPCGTSHRPTFHSFSCHYSLLSASDGDPSSLGFRRARSDGNLESLVPDDHHRRRRSDPMLDAIPSFSIYNSSALEEEEEEEERQRIEEEEQKDGFQAVDGATEGFGGEFSFLGRDQNLRLGGEIGEVGRSAAPPLFLARGLGIDRLGSGYMNAAAGGDGNGGGSYFVQSGNEGEQSDVENYYKRMVEENPSNGLFLRNYAQFLYQSKGDPQRAEEYYSRAILAEPGDGEILSQYAKLVWELHRDKERASTYFEQAVQATPENSHVLAAYAGFLWDTEDDGEEEEGEGQSQSFFGAPVHHGALTSAST